MLTKKFTGLSNIILWFTVVTMSLEGAVIATAQAGVPDQITDLTAAGGNQEVRLNWTAPDDNGSPITDYEIHYSDDGFTSDDQIFADGVSTDTSDIIITGLTDFTTYSFRVRGINGNGTAASPGSNTVEATPTTCGELDDNVEAGSTTSSEECVQVGVNAGSISLTNIPDSFSFPTKFFSFSGQNSFSNDNPATTTTVDVTTGPEDVITVQDLRNSGGFDLNISVSTFSSGSNQIPIARLYAVSTYPDDDDLTPLDPDLNGTEAGGVEYATGSSGAQDITSGVFTTGNLNLANTYTTNGDSFDANNDLVSDMVSLMSTSTAHTMSASQALSFYLNIPADQPAGNYSVLFTLDLIPN